MREKLLKLSQIVELTGTAESTLRLWISRGQFPSHTHDLPGAKGARWSERVVFDWIDQRERKAQRQRAKINSILRLERPRKGALAS
jgi:predicted DNA-binding transcriptional regulator AlpA